jgi:adenosylhomocysteine nucleosidase
MRAEARCLAGLDVLIGCSGARPERARPEAARLVAGGAAGLVSFGLAGGLSPELAAGDLVLADMVMLPDRRLVVTDAAWRRRLAALLGAAGIPALEKPLAGSDRLLASVAAKAALRWSHAACAVDMESHALAVAAQRAGLPLLVVRAIADPSKRVIPEAAQGVLGPDGVPRVAALLGGLLRRPGDLPALLRLARDSSSGLATLRRVAALAAPDLAFR